MPREHEQKKSGSLADRVVGAASAFLALGLAMTCAGGGAVAGPPPGSEPLPVSTPLPTPEVITANSSASFEPPPIPVAPPPLSPANQRAPELRRFFAALDELAAQQRSESVRIAWFGDSHTAADYYPGAVRSALARHYGNGGPGFVRLGLPSYRHDWAVVNRVGHLRVEPEPPARRSLQDDGVFGLGGMRVSPIADPVRMTVKLRPGAVEGKARFRLLFDLQQSGAFAVTLGNKSLHVSNPRVAQTVEHSPILRVDLEGSPTDVLTIDTRKGRPHFYGVTVDGSEPGVVVDTLGIDGARLATALAWTESAFVAEVAARSPDLVVIAYGTNEAFDGLNVGAYDRQLTEFVGRLRRGSPKADCLVLGPPDALAPAGESVPRVAAISAVLAKTSVDLGCAFVSAQSLMGGPGSFAAWLREAPQLSRSDRIHLTLRGYRKLGELVAGAVFGEPPAATEAEDKYSP